MSECYLEIVDGNSVIHIDGPATIDIANEIRHVFSDAAGHDLPVIIDVEKTTDADCSFIQLIASLCCTLKKSKLTLRLAPLPLPDPVDTAVKSLGFTQRRSCTRAKECGCCFAPDLPVNAGRE